MPTIRELIDMSEHEIKGFLATFTEGIDLTIHEHVAGIYRRLGGVLRALDLPDVAAQPEKAAKVSRLVNDHITVVDALVVQTRNQAERERNETERAAIHHMTNFVDRDGRATGSWGPGSDAVKEALRNWPPQK